VIAKSAISPQGIKYIQNAAGAWLIMGESNVTSMPHAWHPPLPDARPNSPSAGWQYGTEVVLTLKQEEMHEFAKRSGYPMGIGNAISLDWVNDKQMQHLGQLGSNAQVVAALVRYWKERDRQYNPNMDKLNKILDMLGAEHEADSDSLLEVPLEGDSDEAGRGTSTTPEFEFGGLTAADLERTLRSLQSLPPVPYPTHGQGLGRVGTFGQPLGPLFNTAIR
jgi:hypothetical protein